MYMVISIFSKNMVYRTAVIHIFVMCTVKQISEDANNINFGGLRLRVVDGEQPAQNEIEQ